jgi:hypothetical protein
MSFPIIDTYHVLLPFVVALSYLVKDIKINKKYTRLLFLIFIITTSTYNAYLNQKYEYTYPNELTTFKFRKADPTTIKVIKDIKNYLKNKEEKIFVINQWAYLIKLESNLPINKYDLLNNGNLGKNGEHKIINKISNICEKEKCIFLLNKSELHENNSQYNKKILQYINDTYYEIGMIYQYVIYEN